MADEFGAERNITIARELTKLFETIHSCPLGAVHDWLAAEPHRIKGEFVLIVEGAEKRSASDADIDLVLEILLRELPLKQVVKLAAEISGARRNDVYARALQLKEKS